jgi:hypothetical protein
VLKDLQRVLARALTSNAPLETLRAEKAGLAEADRALLDALNLEHFLLSSFLVRKLRFERICRGDTAAEEWFAREPERFTEAFQAYNAAVPPVEFFPRPEALAFRAWCRTNGFAPPEPSA